MSTNGTYASSLGRHVEQAKWEFALPDGGRRLIASNDLGESKNESMVNWLESDPVLRERLLNWCNSPLYKIDQPYQSLGEVLQVLDRDEFSYLAILAFVRGLFLPDASRGIPANDRLWGHSIAVGATASMIARTCGCSDPNLVFAAGALHDIGLRGIEKLSPKVFASIQDQVDELSEAWMVELEVLGWDHTELGAAILQQWGMPEAIRQTAKLHHRADHEIDSEYAETVCCVSVANYLCSRSGWSSTSYHNLAPPSDRILRRIGINSRMLSVIFSQLIGELESVVHLR